VDIRFKSERPTTPAPLAGPVEYQSAMGNNSNWRNFLGSKNPPAANPNRGCQWAVRSAVPPLPIASLADAAESNSASTCGPVAAICSNVMNSSIFYLRQYFGLQFAGLALQSEMPSCTRAQ